MTERHGERTGELTNPDYGPGVGQQGREAWKFVSLVRDGMMLAMGCILLWSVSTLHTLVVGQAEIRASKFSIEQAVAMKAQLDKDIAEVHRMQGEQMRAVQLLLTQLAADTAEIKGRIEGREEFMQRQGRPTR